MCVLPAARARAAWATPARACAIGWALARTHAGEAGPPIVTKKVHPGSAAVFGPHFLFGPLRSLQCSGASGGSAPSILVARNFTVILLFDSFRSGATHVPLACPPNCRSLATAKFSLGLAQLGPMFASLSPILAKSEGNSIFGQIQWKLDRILLGSGRNESDLVELAEVRPDLPMFGRIWPKSGRFSIFGQSWPKWTNSGRCWPTFGRCWPSCSKL